MNSHFLNHVLNKMFSNTSSIKNLPKDGAIQYTSE